MEYTDYFKHTRLREDRKNIKLSWIEYVYNNPDKLEIQSDGRIRKWAKIHEVDKYLRIVILKDNKTIHNAFFDRSFKK